jgi:sigma-E factor negative regulatory protein RseA
MDDRLKESISALLDNEADELEIRRILKESDNGELRSLWGRYNKVSDVLSSGRQVHDQYSSLDIDISSRISQAIDNEDPVGVIEGHGDVSFSEPKKASSSFMRWAGVAAVLVLTVSIVFNPFGADPLTDEGLYALEEQTLAPEDANRLNEYLLRHAGNSVTGGRSGLMPLVRVASLSMTAY